MAAPGRGPIGDPALDRPKLVTDMCKNIDLTMGAFQINHLVSRFRSWNLQKDKNESSANDVCVAAGSYL
jgi:hypothetical protein